MKMKKKRGVEAPFKVRTFISSVTNTSMENVDFPLSKFSWDFEKGDLYHWVDLLNYFEAFFEKHVKPRRDLQLDISSLQEDGAFPKECVLQILRVTRILLENCMNKYLYSSNEHLSALFASSDPEVVIAALETLAAFVKKPLQSTRAMRWHGDAALNARLFSLSQGWGGKEEGLGLLSCATENGCDTDACRMGSTLHFEFYADGGQQGNGGNDVYGSSGLQVIHLSDMQLRSEGDLQLLKELSDKYMVPSGLRFSLLMRIRFARAFASLVKRRQFICIRLLAFTILLQSNPDHEDLTAFFVNEPELVNELVMVLRCEDSVPEVIRTLAVLALAAQSQDRPRQSNVLNVISAGGHRGILPSLMQKAIGSLTGGRRGCTIAFVEALLTLVAVLVSSSSGCAALREAGLIATLLPLLKDFDSGHIHLVSSAVHILEAFMDYSNPAGTLFRDLGGLDDTIERLKLEVSKVEDDGSKLRVDLQLASKGKMPMSDNPTARQNVQPEMISYHQRLLLKALLRAIALGTYAPGSSARLHTSEDSALPLCLSIIFRHSKEFGGGVFSLAASVMSDLIHKDPTCFPALDTAGVPSAFLSAITSGVLPSSEAVGCIPNSLDALCLNNTGLQAVKDTNALKCFVKIFTSKLYLRALSNDTPGSLASGLDELMRHAPSLRGPGIDMCVDILKTIATIGGVVEMNLPAVPVESFGYDLPVPMDTDSEDQSTMNLMADDGQQAGASHHSVEPSWEGSEALVESFLPECINNAVRLLETVLQNADASRIFIEKKGIEALLQLYTLPHLPVAFGASSTAHNMSVTFRAFSPQHSSVLTHAVCCGLKEHLKQTVEALESLGGTRIATVDPGISSRVIKCLSAAECFISLSAVLVRSSAAMMPELSNGVSILSDIGRIQKEVLWQIALIDDAKCDVKKDVESYGSTPGSSSMSMTARDGDDDAVVFPVIRYVNPLPSRSGPAHWGLEADFLPVLQSGIEGPPRRRRELPVTTEAITQMARLGRLSRHSTDAIQVDFEPLSSLPEASQAHESSRRKTPETVNYEMMTRLVAASRGLFVALGKAMVIPSSRRRDETVNISGPAKVIASALAELLHDELSFDGEFLVQQYELPVSVKCRYLGKVAEDVMSVVFDSRRRTCNTVMVNCLVGHGALKQLLETFSATSQLLWRVPRNSTTPMETENSKMDREKVEGNCDSNAWLSETLKIYARLLEQLVTSSLLLTPPSMAQLLVQPVPGGSEPIAKDPEAFIRAFQAQVLEIVLPVWTHPLFPQCSASFITSIASIITHIYSGVGDAKVNRNGSIPTAHVSGPPPDELAISRIVEMGFSRSRAEDALRRVEANSVEMATEWLCNLPEGGVQEDDELAHALALSLGSSDSNPNSEQPGIETDAVTDEVCLQPPPVEDMLSTCMNLLQNSDAVAFALADLFVTMCHRNKGRDRSRVICFLVQQLKQCRKEETEGDGGSLSTICHALAIVLSEDYSAREIACESGLVEATLDALTSFSSRFSKGRFDVPKWVTSMLLILHHMLQYKPRISSDAPAGTPSTLATAVEPKSDHETFGSKNSQKELEGNPFASILGAQTGYMTNMEQVSAMKVCCNFLGLHLPATGTQAVLMLCARLTKTHAVAHQFLEAGGLNALLDLPMTSLFPGFEIVAATIIRHLLEDPQTLQQAMESEIRHTLASTLSRHNGRVSPRMFLTAMSPVVSRDPSIFMQAVGGVCQIEKVGGRPTVVLAKDKERERDKEKERGKAVNAVSAVGPDVSKNHEGGSKFGKSHKKIPASFSQVIDQLLEIILHHPSPLKNLTHKDASETPMEVDDSLSKDKGKAKLDDVAKQEIDHLSDNSAELSRIAFILKLATEILLMYSSAVSVVLRRDSESSQGRGPSQGGLDVIGHGGLIYHVLHRLLPYPRYRDGEKVNDEELREKVSDRAAYFLMAVCVRSGEGRRRVVAEISRALIASAIIDPEKVLDLQIPSRKVQVFVDLANSIVSSHSPSNSSQPPGFAAETAKSMLDAGMIQALTQCLKIVDLDHPDAPKLVNAVLKVLEVLTRAGNDEQACGSDDTSNKRSEISEPPGAGLPNLSGRAASDSHLPDVIRNTDEAMDAVHTGPQSFDGSSLAGPDSNRDDLMEHDMRPERNGSQLNADEEEEFMREAAEDAAELEDAAAEMAYRMEHGADEVADEDEDDMDGDEGEDDDDEEEDEEDDEDDIDGDVGVSHLSPPDTDVEDHEDAGLGDEYEDDMVDEEDDEDDWHEDRVLEVRWRDGLTGLNHVQVLGHTSAANLVDFSGDPFQGMNIDDVFGNFRRPAGGDRRRATTYRSFPERTGDRSGAFHHPLLTRPPPMMGTSASGSVTGGSLWSNSGSFVRDAEAMLSGGGLDVTHFYMYDAPLLPDHAGDALFGERGVSAPPPPLLDFSMDPVYLMGRRGGRADSRLTTWTDDGQPQAGAHAAALAQAIEEQFVSHLQILAPRDDQSTGQEGNVNGFECAERAAEGRPGEAESMEGAIPAVVRSAVGSGSTENLDRVEEVSPLNGDDPNEVARPSSLGTASAEPEALQSPQRVTTEVAADLDMQDERNETVVPDNDGGSQDSAGSGATVGESLRSLEVEIGSADGHDPDERQAGSDRIVAGESQRTVGLEVMSRETVPVVRVDAVDTDEEMDATESATAVRLRLGSGEGVAAPPIQPTDTNRDTQEGVNVGRNTTNSSVNPIDPTFLEALPEDLRAEVLASQQTQSLRPVTRPPSVVEDIDPEFLAALPPDIQAEVLAQQRAQRTVHTNNVEGQPVDMDSASIIATFPSELREEVLLTSSEAVLAALPPALLAEAQLLRERAMNQYQARGLFGGHRIASRRSSMGLNMGGGVPNTLDRSVMGSSGLSIGRRPVASLNSGTRIKEAEGKVVVDIGALKSMLRLLQLAQPLGKGLLPRLLLNLCAHSITRVTLVQLLLDMLRPEAEGIVSACSSDGPSLRLYGCQWNVVYARSQVPDGVPPLVSRRVLEILTYLARNHSLVADLLLYLRPERSQSSMYFDRGLQKAHEGKVEKGKAKVVDEPIENVKYAKPHSECEIPLILLLKLLSQPLYCRSSAHLEQVMGLLEVVTSSAGAKAEVSTRSKPVDAANAAVSASANTDGSTNPREGAVVQRAEIGPDDTLLNAEMPCRITGPLQTSSVLNVGMDAASVLMSLPEPELRNLCTLLACDGLSDTAYTRVAEVLKKLAVAVPAHRKLFVSELAAAARKLGGPAVSELESLGDMDNVALSPTSMAGAAILRVLQALGALITTSGTGKDTDEVLEKEHGDGIVAIRDLNSALENLWFGLSSSVGRIEGMLGNSNAVLSPGSSAVASSTLGGSATSAPLPPGAQKLLPYVEGFFVLCEKLRSGPSCSNSSEPFSSTVQEIKESASCSTSEYTAFNSPKSPTQIQRKPDEKGMTFIRFAEKHRRLLNAFVRQNPALLEKSFSMMLKSPRLIEFDNKRAYFRSRIRQQHEQQHYAPLRICVRRAYVLEDSYNQLRMRTPDELKGRLTVQFQGEEGIDAGGLTREWYQLLSRVTFDKGALLFTTVGNDSTFQPNPNSVYQTEHLSYFKFVGRVVGKALFDGQLLDVYFTRSFYKHILGVKVTYLDIEAIDPDYYKNLKWMLENDISDIIGLTFSMDADEEKHILYEKTEVTDYELIAGGRNIRVTEENKHEYVELVAEHRLTTAIRPQITSFLEGFNEIVSRDLVSIFNDKELELLISGLPEIDLEDLKANTEYTGYTPASPVVQWFWEVVRSFSKEDMARLLQFITGTSKVPLEGFRALQGISGPQRFQIHKAYGAPERLPSAHTCFNQLDLPEYSLKEQLSERLLLAIHEASEGFGFG